MRCNPVMLAGRDRHEVTVGPDRAPVDVDLVVLNMGQQPGTASVTETIPAGVVAEGFPVPPDATIPLTTGQTSYRFDGIPLAGAEPTPRDQHSIYDRWQLRYTLRPVTDGLGRYQSHRLGRRRRRGALHRGKPGGASMPAKLSQAG